MEKGYLQHKAELSRFDDSVIRDRHAFEQAAAQKAAVMRALDPLQDAVSGNDNILYKPNHHSADYAGFVSRDALERQHFEGKQKESVIKTEYGMLPADNVRTSDHIGIGRKHFENDVRFSSREVVPGSAPLIADPSHYLEGSDRNRFQSTAMAAQCSLPTEPISYSTKSINNLNVGKKHVIPAYEKNSHLGDVTNYNGGGRQNISYSSEPPRNRGDLVGYRATAFKSGAQSMISGIGSSIAGTIARDFPDRPAQRETIHDFRGREKGTHLLDIAPGLTPGYTGKAIR